MQCYECLDVVTPAEAIACSGCRKWAHKKCVFVKQKEIERLNWICSPCLGKLRFLLYEGENLNKKLDTFQKSMEDKLHDVDSKVEAVREVLTKVEEFAKQPTSHVCERLVNTCLL